MTTYWYDARPVVDPISGGSVLVPNADFTVHAYNDTAFATPLTVQTRLGGVLGSTSELHSTPNGILDEFSVEDEWRVWLKSGEHVVLHTSSQGLADAADASRVAAQNAQAAAEAAAADAAEAVGATTAQIDAYLGGDASGLVGEVASKADLDVSTGKLLASQMPTVSAADATTTTKGSVQLSGDLGGTAASPTVPGLVNKADNATTVHTAGNETIAGTKNFTAPPVVPDGSFSAAKLSATGTRDATTYLRGDNTWALVAGGTGDVPATRQISTGTGLTGGGDLSANRTLAVSFGTAAGTVAQGSDTRIVGAAQKASNLSDLASAVTARANLGVSATVYWSGTAWPARPADTKPITWSSTTDPLAPSPTGQIVGDVWDQHPDAE